MNKSYPKIIIIGETFHLNSGGGITLSNLFSDWPIEKLANAVDFISPSMNKHFTSINIYELYESKMIFKILSHKYFQNFRSSSISNNNISNNNISNNNISNNNISNNNISNKSTYKSLIKLKLKRFAYYLLEISGLKPIIFEYKIDQNFLKWIETFNPDYIYTQLSTRESIKFISKLHDCTHIPIAIHMMDDWPSTISSKGVLKYYWKKKINNEFKSLLDKTSVFLSISEYMSDEYFIRYGKCFIPFHNPLNLDIWANYNNKPVNIKQKYIFLHAGRIGLGISNSLLKIAVVLQELNNIGIHVYLHIQSSNIDPQFRNRLLQFNCVIVNPPALYTELPKIMQNADILVLCNDFDEKSKTFLKFSMPTKASEYMISQVPILLFSDSKSAIYKHAEKYKWAYLVGQNDHFQLKNAIIELINNSELRKVISESAFQFAKMNFDSNIVTEKFRNIFS